MTAPLAPEIRLGSDEDGPAIGRVIAACFAPYPGCLFAPAEFPELAAIASHFAARGGAIWVAAHGPRIVGSLAVGATTDPSVYELSKVYLLGHERGAGVAGRMLDLAEAFVTARGANRLRLWTDTRFLEAHRFYQRRGFARIPARRRLVDISDTWEFAFAKTVGAGP